MLGTPTFWMPLAAAIIFSLGTLLIKRAASYRLDIWRISFVSNCVSLLFFLPFFLQAQTVPPIANWWQVLVVAMLFVVGQVFTLVSMTEGEISVAAPVLGLKLLFVPLFLSAMRLAELPRQIWIACGIASLAIALLNFTDRRSARGRIAFSVICASLGAAAYALFDVSVQSFAPLWPTGTFLPSMFVVCMALSFAFVPFFKAPLSAIPKASWPYLLSGTMLFSLQAIFIICAVAFYGNAAIANVVYGTRGLFGLLFIWMFGSLLGIADQSLSNTVFVVRLVGAVMLMAAILILGLT